MEFEKVKMHLGGLRFGTLIVKYINRFKQKIDAESELYLAMWLCECDCGEEIEATTSELLSSKIKDCGRDDCKLDCKSE